jgi:molybdopterin synthase sulfur carrier subunit
MPVKVKFSPSLSYSVGGQDTIDVTGNTIGECLDGLELHFPGIKEKILNEKGEVKSYVVILLNGKNTYPEELSLPVRNSDEISIIFMIDGG